jgi:hypothetical protein
MAASSDPYRIFCTLQLSPAKKELAEKLGIFG